VKVLLGETPEALGRFRREARALLSLDHPGIVRVFDVVQEGPSVTAIVMELLEGETLRQRLLREAPLPAPVAARLVGDVATAVVFAHGRGVLHRDLKPENVFLCSDGRTQVLDFGLSRWLEPEGAAPRTGSVVTQQGTKLGTLPYMAPEQLTDASTVDAAADAWALGVVLYECVAGFLPFEARSEPEMVQRILIDAIAPLAFVAPEVPEPLATLVDQLLARDRATRVHALGEAVQALGSAARGAA
jgi:serine/threonine-protein kinase